MYQVSCGIRFGTTSQSSTTTFTDTTGTQLFWKRYTYYYSGATVDALNYSDYYVIDGYGNTTGPVKTGITLGSVVGSGDNRQGVFDVVSKNTFIVYSINLADTMPISDNVVKSGSFERMGIDALLTSDILSRIKYGVHQYASTRATIIAPVSSVVNQADSSPPIVVDQSSSVQPTNVGSSDNNSIAKMDRDNDTIVKKVNPATDNDTEAKIFP